jgi:cytochrome c oxidase subunit 3
MSSTPSYYVPEQSKLPIFASIGLATTVYGLASWLNGHGNGPMIMFVGFLIFAFVLWNWFSIVIDENIRGLNSDQLKRSYVWGMGWFIFSEVMFFAAFFGALFYIRTFALPWLGGDGSHDSGTTNSVLWPGFEQAWPLMQTPDMAVNGDSATVTGPEKNMSFSEAASLWTWLPFWNTVILLTSSFTVHFAHTGLKNDNRKSFIGWLGFTVLLGCIFLVVQVYEYYHAYAHLGLTLDSGIYGTTFFMLTGFHGAHVTLGTFMLAVMLGRAIKGHFKHDDCFGFESASWYWHFVDVVWLGLFIFVYILG